MKKRIFSGVQPSGDLHLGNYLGAISQWVGLQDTHDCIFCVVDYHAMTVKQDPEVLRKKIIETAKLYIASGINPEKSIIFQQSDVAAHTELAWILNATCARMSDLNKMTQFKDKAGRERENVGVGLFDYPVLMAADIILYNTDVVPVGEDQVQHVELARTLARRFNNNFAEVFKVPQCTIRKAGARIMGLDKPENKMSKSAVSEFNYIALTDSPKLAKKKIMKATTDSDAVVAYDIENKPGVSNLLTIYSLLSGREIEDIVKEYDGKMYGDFKKGVAGVVGEFLIEFQERYNALSDDEVREVINRGAREVDKIASETMAKVKKAVGVK
jgi:tryptophanyl-tRNA synthetase